MYDEAKVEKTHSHTCRLLITCLRFTITIPLFSLFLFNFLLYVYIQPNYDRLVVITVHVETRLYAFYSFLI